MARLRRPGSGWPPRKNTATSCWNSLTTRATDRKQSQGPTGGGEPQAPSRGALRRRARRVAEILHSTYGPPRHGNKDDPLDELVFILLSQMTTGASFNRVYDRVKAAYPTWDPFLAMPLAEVKAVIKDAG